MGILGNKEIEKSEVKLFSTQENSEEFLVDSGFIICFIPVAPEHINAKFLVDSGFIIWGTLSV